MLFSIINILHLIRQGRNLFEANDKMKRWNLPRRGNLFSYAIIH